MNTRKHAREIALPLPPEKIFSLLITPSAIREWWNVSRAIVQQKKEGIWIAAWGENEDAPDYITTARMSVFDPPNRIVMTGYDYYSKSGPLPFSAQFETEFLITRTSTGSILRVTQDGFPADAIADEFYASCETGWETTLNSIKQFAERRR